MGLSANWAVKKWRLTVLCPEKTTSQEHVLDEAPPLLLLLLHHLLSLNSLSLSNRILLRHRPSRLLEHPWKGEYSYTQSISSLQFNLHRKRMQQSQKIPVHIGRLFGEGGSAHIAISYFPNIFYWWIIGGNRHLRNTRNGMETLSCLIPMRNWNLSLMVARCKQLILSWVKRLQFCSQTGIHNVGWSASI